MTFIKPATTFIQPFSVSFDLAEGIMHDPASHLVRRAADMQGHYRDREALAALIALIQGWQMLLGTSPPDDKNEPGAFR